MYKVLARARGEGRAERDFINAVINAKREVCEVNMNLSYYIRMENLPKNFFSEFRFNFSFSFAFFYTSSYSRFHV